MSSEVVTFNDLKKVLELSGHSPSGYIHIDVPTAYMYGYAPTATAVTTGTYYYLNSFSGSYSTKNITNIDYYEEDTNGFKILREGIYKISLQVHFNSAATGVTFSTRFLNYTDSATIGIYQYISDDAKGWGSTDNEWIGFIGANKIVVPQFCRYAGSANIRPTNFVYSITLLHDPNAAELFQGGSSSGEVTDATATPTPDKVSKFDNNAFMNSEDMSSSDVEDFIEDLDVSGGGSGGGGIPNVDDFTEEELDDFVDELNATGTYAVDYVIEQGLVNSWYVRKWNSGRYECWRRYSFGETTFSTATNIFYHDFDGINYPITFAEIPTQVISHTVAGVWVGGYDEATTINTGTIRMYSSTAAAKSCIIGIYVWGKWK